MLSLDDDDQTSPAPWACTENVQVFADEAGTKPRHPIENQVIILWAFCGHLSGTVRNCRDSFGQLATTSN
jgi:hypothetical protein